MARSLGECAPNIPWLPGPSIPRQEEAHAPEPQDFDLDERLDLIEEEIDDLHGDDDELWEHVSHIQCSVGEELDDMRRRLACMERDGNYLYAMVRAFANKQAVDIEEVGDAGDDEEAGKGGSWFRIHYLGSYN